MDKISKARRALNMRAIRSKDTSPEIAVRSLAHRLGYRFRLHRADLPGKPDMTFTARRAVVQVNGCFWHAHGCKDTARSPKSNADYWAPKLTRNVARDKMNLSRLNDLGWRTLTVWECETADEARLASRLRSFLGSRMVRSLNLAAGARVNLATLRVSESAIHVETELSPPVARAVRIAVLKRLASVGLTIRAA